MEQNVVAENKMGVRPVNRLLLGMSIPMAISMLVQALYNIVDSIYVSQIPSVTENAAFTAVSLAFPIQQLMIAIATGTAVGVNALLSRSLGEKNQKLANRSAGNGIVLAFLSSIVFILFGLFGTRFFFAAQTANAEVIQFGVDYLSVICTWSFGIFGGVMFDRLLQATGKTVYAMCTMLLGAIINIILDPILIFGWFGITPMGAKGAAVATVVGQIAAMLLSILLNVKKNNDIQLTFSGLRLMKKIVKPIYVVGVPSIVMMSIGSVMVFSINQIVASISVYAVAVFGAYFKLQSFIFMPIFGLNNGVIPIAAYNYGAKKPDRMKKTLKLGCMYAVLFMLFGLIIFQFCPHILLSFFELSEGAVAVGIPALRTISISFLFAGVCIIGSGFFQALGNGVYSLICSVLRQLAVLVPAAWLLGRTGNIDLVWWSFPLAEVAAIIVTTFFLRRIFRKKVNPLYSAE